jgi:protein-disulfide isomerase
MKSLVIGLLLSVLFVFCDGICLAAPITGNPDGAVRLVEYYDYECPHCRRMEPVIDSLQAEYQDLRVIHRVTPLLTPASRGIASVALAAKMQNQKVWFKIHNVLMQLNATPTLSNALHIATELGLNPETLSHEMQDKAVQHQINQNIKSANKYAIDGAIYLPILVFSQSNGQGQSIILRGEQPRALLSAIVQQLGDQHVQVVKEKNTTERSS